jgi:hypothetical protein
MFNFIYIKFLIQFNHKVRILSIECEFMFNERKKKKKKQEYILDLSFPYNY